MQTQIKILCFLILLPFVSHSQHFLDDDIEENDNENIHYGRWVKLENSINEFPICYQLWECDKSHLDDDTIIKNRLPQGEWGLCENYLDPKADDLKFCSRCDVAPPEELCY